MSKQEPAAGSQPAAVRELLWLVVLQIKWELRVVGAGFFFLELFPLQKRAENSPAQQMFLEGCATADNG